MQLSADVCNMVSFIVSFLIALGSDAFINVLLTGMTFHPSDFDSTGAFGLNSFEEVLPEVPITDKLPLLVGLFAIPYQFNILIGFVDESSTI